MILFKLFGERLLIFYHSTIKFLFDDDNIVNLVVEVLAYRKTIAFLLDLG